MAEIQGSYDDLFVAVPSVLADLLDKGDVGGSVAVYVDGVPVVDVWGGFADADRTIPWQRDSIANVWSVTKTMTALCALILADRGQLDLNAPVAAYWPQFAASGKQNVLVRHVLGHTAGLPDWEGTVDELYDWQTVTERLAAHAPQWEPGTAAGYHSVTQGFLIGELVRRITGRTLGQFFAEEVAGPLGADFHIGLPADCDDRVASTVPPPSQSQDYAARAPGASEADVEAATAAQGRRAITVRDGNSVAWRRAEIPAANGVGNARSVGLVQSILACGGAVDGVRLLSPEGCAWATELQFAGEDRVLGRPMRWGMGYGLFGGSTFGWGGWGGSLVVVEPDERMVVAYVTNQMAGGDSEFRGLETVMAAYDGLKGLRR